VLQKAKVDVSKSLLYNCTELSCSAILEFGICFTALLLKAETVTVYLVLQAEAAVTAPYLLLKAK
jgi:hypothetical protein